MPTIGRQGMKGQIMIVAIPRTPLTTIIIKPTIRMSRRETKPTQREMKRSTKAWNFRSREALLDVLPAEICR